MREVDALDGAIDEIESRVPNARGTPLDLRAVRERARSRPGEALALVQRAWSSTTSDPSCRLTEPELAEVMRIFHENWLRNGLEGTPVSDGTWTFRCARVNRAAAKRLMTELATWARKGVWPPWVEACRKIRDDVMKKTDGPYETYSQLLRALETLRSQATTGVQSMVNDGDTGITHEDAMEFDRDLQKWITRKWGDNEGLPPLDEKPKSNEPFFASGLETEHASSKRAPPRDRSVPVSPSPPPAKKAKSDSSKAKAASPHVELPRSIKREVTVSESTVEDSEAGSSMPAARETEMNIIRHSLGVIVRARCYGLDAELVIIPPFGLQNGVKTNGEMAAMVFRETQAALQANIQPAESAARCTHNDGKAWRCPGSRVDNTPFCTKHRPVKFATTSRVHPVSFTTQQGLEITYNGPPSACIIRSIASNPIDALDPLMLKDPENFEAHAWEVENRLKSCDGLVRRDGPGGRFRQNAVVLERGGVWVPYPIYEARLSTMLPGTPPGSSIASETVLNKCIEDINLINTSRRLSEESGAKEFVEEPKIEGGTENAASAPVQHSSEDETAEKMPRPTGAREIRLRLAELHRQLNGVKREITAMQDTGVEHAENHKREGGDEESEYDAFERSVNRALCLKG